MKKVPFIIIGLIFFGCGPDIDILQVVLVSPSKVELVFPENNQECTAGTIISETESEVIFDWTDAEVGDRYSVSVTNLTTGQEAIFESDSSSLPIKILRGTPYSWHVINILNDLDTPTASDVEVFYNAGPGIQSFIPFPAQNVAPINGEQFDSTSTIITLEWSAEDLDGDIVGYDLYFGLTNSPELFAADLNTAIVSNISINAGNTYFWRIVTKDTQGNQSNSEIFTFEVLN